MPTLIYENYKAFIEALKEDPEDEATRLVFADWLEENGDTKRAKELRAGLVHFGYDELDENAKEKAREWFCAGHLDYEWWEYVYEDAARIAEMLGIDLRTRQVKLMNGKTRFDPCIWFSGFSSQGDGACFEGTYRFQKGGVKKLKQYAPTDVELWKIADGLFEEQRSACYSITANIEHRGHYYHSGCMSIDCSCERGSFDEETVIQLLRDFADWIYAQLEKEHDYQLSDDFIAETIRENEYQFDAEGNNA